VLAQNGAERVAVSWASVQLELSDENITAQNAIDMTRFHAAAATAAFDLALLFAEAGAVIALRTWMLGANLAPAGEAQRMINEKQAAFAKAAVAAWEASFSAAWQHPLDPARATFAGAAASTASLTRKTRSNRRRLVRGTFSLQ